MTNTYTPQSKGWFGYFLILFIALLCSSAAFAQGSLPAAQSAQAPAIQVWQQAIKQTHPAKAGCFQASYPNTQWQQVICDQSRKNTAPLSPPPRPANGTLATPATPVGGIGYSARAVGGSIRAAEGSIINATGVTSIMDSLGGADYYTLQLNTDYFAIPASNGLCGNSSNCYGWVQFGYINNEPYAGTMTLQYWIIGSDVCSWPWSAYDTSTCVSGYFSSSAAWTSIPGKFSNFKDQINLSGQTANGIDTVTLTVGANAYSYALESPLKILPQLWQQAQFNVFGAGNYSTVNFNNGSSLIINTKIDNGTTNAPDCSTDTGTGESNNLYLNSPCCRYGGGKPSIAFSEGTDGNPNKFTCADLGNNTITPLVSSAGGGTISPSAALQVPNGAVSTFTIIPSANHKIGSVTGCGGSLIGNVYSTAPATNNCTVTASFVFDTSTFTVNTYAYTTGGTISPPSAQVNPGATYTFTVTPNAGYYINQVWGCGGDGDTVWGSDTHSTALTYTTGPITANCTVRVLFAKQRIIITGNAGAGGKIGPSSYAVDLGTTFPFHITPNTGYYIKQIYGCNGTSFTGSSANTTALTYTTGAITGACTVYATFTKAGGDTYTVTANAGTGGTISPASAQVNSGATQIFTVTPNAGYYINQIYGCYGTAFTGNNANTTALNYTTGAITSSCTLYATFSPSSLTYTVSTYAPAGGTISPSSATVNSGSTYTFTVTPNSGYRIGSVTGCNGTLNGSTYTTGPVTAACTVSATFTGSQTFTITTSAGPGGTISPPGIITGVPAGTTRTFTVTPNPGYFIYYIAGCGGAVTYGNSSDPQPLTYTTGPMTSNCSIATAFLTPPVIITASAGTGGTISPSPVTVNSGSTYTFTVTPNPGYSISSVTGCNGTLNGNAYTTGSVTAACSVSASFAVLR